MRWRRASGIGSVADPDQDEGDPGEEESARRRSYGATGRRRGAQVAYPDPDRGSQREEWGAWGVVVAAGGS